MTNTQVIVDDLLVSYIQVGAGRDLVLLHGWADNKETFKDIIPDLSKNYRVTALDLPGFGKSQQPPQVWNLTNYSLNLSNFLQKLAINPYAIIAHSNGGALAMHGLANNVLKADKLVLLASSGVRDTQKLRRSLIKLIAKTGKVMTFWLPKSTRRALQKKLYGSVGSDMFVAPALQETFKQTVRQDVQAEAALLSQPTLLIYGDQDRATPLAEVGARLNQLIPGSQLVVLPHTGHFVHHEDPDSVIRNIENFLA